MPDDTNLFPTDDQSSADAQQPNVPTDNIQVPDELVNAGNTNTDYRDDSPETLDEDINSTPGTDSMQSESNGIEPLAEDHDTPFSEPDSPRTDPTQDIPREIEQADIDDTHPATDSESNLDDAERYDEGDSGVTEASNPDAGNAVTGYDSTEEARNTDTAL